MNYRKMLTLLAVGAITACQGPAGTNGADGIDGETGIQGEQGVGGETGTDGQDLAAPGAAIASVTPNALLAGRTTEMRIVGYFTEWDETTAVRITDADDADIEGVEVSTVVVSPVGLVVTATVGADVALGNVKLHVITGDNAQAYMPEGAEVAVTATATSSQTELRAGDQFDILLETAEYMSSPTLNADNCEGVLSAQMSRYSQHKFRVIGLMHPAMNLGDCAMALVQDAETDDEWTSAVVITITAPDVITFNEGVTSGELTYERQFRVISVNAAAGEIVSLRHTVDEANNLDGTGPTMAVFVTGNTEALWQHNGDDSWFEVPSMVERELLFVVASNMEEGDDPVAFNLTQITPNTTMTALQDGATQDQRLPANEGGANEAGRGSWYTFSNESPMWTNLAVAPANEDAFQSRFVVIQNDRVLDSGATSWEGILPAGEFVVGVFDEEQAEDDGILSFGVELSRTEVLSLDDNGQASGTLTTGNETMILVPTQAGHVVHISATRDGEGDWPFISATWQGAVEPVVVAEEDPTEATGMAHVPSLNEGNLVVRISLDGDLGDNGVDFTVNVSHTEALAMDLAGTEGSAPETGAQWFLGNGIGATSLTVTPGTPEHLQTQLAVYSAMGALVVEAEANTIDAGTVVGPFFVSVADNTFVAGQDQTFSIGGSSIPVGFEACFDNVTPLSLEPNENMTWALEGTYTDPITTGVSTYMMVPYLLTVDSPMVLDTFIDSGFDSRLIVLSACTTTSFSSWQNPENLVGHSDDGNDWNGNDLGVDGGVNGALLAPGSYIIGVSTYSRNGVAPGSGFTLNYRLRAQ